MMSESGPGSSHEYSISEIRSKQIEKLENEELQDIESLPELIREYVIHLWNITSKKSAIRKEIDLFYIDKNMFEREDGNGLDGHVVDEWKMHLGDLLQDEFVTYKKLYKVFHENPGSVHDAFKEYIRRSMNRRNIIHPENPSEN